MYNNIKITKEENNMRLSLYLYIQSKRTKTVYVNEVANKFNITHKKAYQFLTTFCNTGLLKKVYLKDKTIFELRELI